jgi:hypothetical protein
MIPNSTLLSLPSVPHTGNAVCTVCTVCRAALESWWKSTHVPSFELVKRPEGKPGNGSVDCGRMTGLNGSAGGAYLENEPRFVCAIDP